jgi:hypothetical protein
MIIPGPLGGLRLIVRLIIGIRLRSKWTFWLEGPLLRVVATAVKLVLQTLKEFDAKR